MTGSVEQTQSQGDMDFFVKFLDFCGFAAKKICAGVIGQSGRGDKTDLDSAIYGRMADGAKTEGHVPIEKRGLLEIYLLFLYYCDAVCLPRFVRLIRKSQENSEPGLMLPDFSPGILETESET